jgi:YfiH family protein
VASIHAGWRGVENRILIKTVATLKKIGCNPAKLHVFVGPHIQKQSFEVGNDVRDQLLNCFKGEKASVWEIFSENKAKVDLHQIVKYQLLEAGISLENTFFVFKDTVSDQNYHSYRRDKENSGRQLSFILLKS